MKNPLNKRFVKERCKNEYRENMGYISAYMCVVVGFGAGYPAVKAKMAV